MKLCIVLATVSVAQDPDGPGQLLNALQPSSVLSRLLAPLTGQAPQDPTFSSALGWLRDAHERTIDVRHEYVRLIEALGNSPREALNHLTQDATAPEGERTLTQTAMLPFRILFDMLQIPTRLVTRPANALLEAERVFFANRPDPQGQKSEVSGQQVTRQPLFSRSLLWPIGMPLIGLPPLVVNLPTPDGNLRGGSVSYDIRQAITGQDFTNNDNNDKNNDNNDNVHSDNDNNNNVHHDSDDNILDVSGMSEDRIESVEDLEAFGDSLKQELRKKVWNSWSQSLTQILHEDGLDTNVPTILP